MFSEDISMFMNEFGVIATLDGNPLEGIYDNGSIEVMSMLGGRSPVFLCAEADLCGIDPRGLTLIINVIRYTVRDNKPDGNGMTIFELENQ